MLAAWEQAGICLLIVFVDAGVCLLIVFELLDVPVTQCCLVLCVSCPGSRLVSMC